MDNQTWFDAILCNEPQDYKQQDIRSFSQNSMHMYWELVFLCPRSVVAPTWPFRKVTWRNTIPSLILFRPRSIKSWRWQFASWRLFTPRQKKRPLISYHIKGPLVAAFRSPLMKVLDRSVETFGLWIVNSPVTFIKSVNQSSIKPCLQEYVGIEWKS